MTNTQYFQRRSNLNLFRADTWRIESGIVRATTYSEDGSSITLGFWGAGDVVGNSLLQQKNYQLECLTPVAASPLLLESCLLGSEAPFAELLSTQMEKRANTAHIHQLQELLIIRSCKRIEDMLLKLLTWLGKRFGSYEETGITIEIFWTHGDLAETLGSSRVTITRSIAELEDQGMIRRLPNRQLFIDKSAYSLDLAAHKLLLDITPASSHSSIIPLVATPQSHRPLSVSYR